jgi:IMP dehydrogenase
MNYSLCYDDVLLEPRYSEIRSRSEINIGSNLSKDIRLDLPILSAPMDTVTEDKMCVAMRRAGGIGVVHRYNSVQEQCKIVRLVSRHGIEPAAAVGTQGDFLQRAKELVRNGAKIICIDVAHGHHVLVKEAIRKLKNELNSVHIMAGNVATARAFEDLSNWGADSIKVGIGGGSICSTRIQTGHGVSALQSVMDCSSVSMRTGTKLIADGGIKNSGDIVKALAAGADFVMLGSLLAGTQESPGDVINTPNGKFKTYRGMASQEAQRDWKGSTSSREGISTHIPFKGNVDEILEELSVGIRSGFSYTGARTLPELHEFSKFIKQTNAGRNESNTHILNLK